MQLPVCNDIWVHTYMHSFQKNENMFFCYPISSLSSHAEVVSIILVVYIHSSSSSSFTVRLNHIAAFTVLGGTVYRYSVKLALGIMTRS